MKKLFLITKTDGGEFIGEIISDDGREMLLMTATIGKIYINKSDISRITFVDEKSTNKVGGEFRAEGPFTTRYFLPIILCLLKRKNIMLLFSFMDLKFTFQYRINYFFMASWMASPICSICLPCGLINPMKKLFIWFY